MSQVSPASTIAVAIPTLNEEVSLARRMVSLLRNAQSHDRIIIADGPHYPFLAFLKPALTSSS